MNLEELNSLISYVKRKQPNGTPIARFIQESYKPDFEHERKLALFEGYLQTLEGYLEQEAQQAKDKIRQTEAKIDEEFEKLNQKVKAGLISSEPNVVDRHQEEILDQWRYELQYADYWSDTVDEFADTLRKSFFINLYGFWESQLFPLCKALEPYENMPKVENALDFGPAQAKEFLGKINVPLGGGTAWCTINNYRLLRNCLVHNNGDLERCGKKDRKNIESFLSKRPLLSIDKKGDIFLNTADVVLVRKEKVTFYRIQELRNMLSESGEICFKKGEVICLPESIGVFQEDFTFQKDNPNDSATLRTLEEKEQIIFRKGKTIICRIDEDDPVNLQEADAVIFQEGSNVIFRQGSIFRSMVVINKGFCEESLETFTQFFEDLQNALTQWALSQTES